ncbi:MAG: multifunctional oxoglutarate decarboxylase/oxoglutarate dehydrogenase thiamine pyrophosphate-binding subunit/dihydrolipoyllysine-residue succinyltransferase subunit [Candidatus Dormibacteraeota bacterium]|nr:multifunctional oxoglutarate decarboxylase/oxoglutarate dehydrogenase thiamine pyrophosphate-binding subunit/dihydrolipoyllysine-residue succinyltransferase subunit [Candidatus Dormibacteraeota bacterium]
MGESVTEGTVSRWLKAVGDSVTEGESLVEVTTDKVDVEVPSPAAGTLEAIVAQEGETVSVGATLATIAAGANGAAARPAADATAAPEPAADAAAAASNGSAEAGEAPSEAEAPEEVAAATPAQPPSGAAAAVNASPLARRRAAIQGTDPAAATGTGPGGLVRAADVTAASKGPAAAPAKSAAPVAPAGEGTVELRGPAASLVDYMELSRDIPTATSFRSVAVTVLDARRRELNLGLTTAGKHLKVSFTHLIGYAISRAAAEMPEMSAHFARTEQGKPARVDSGVHLGLAVDSRRKDGSRFLVVPVITDAGTRTFAEFHSEYERLIERARTNTLAADELRGATITLTNPGGIGTVASVPRLMPGQGTIVAIGALGYPPEWKEVPESRLRELGVAKVMTMTSTYDHRVIQGAQSGEFLGRIQALLDGEGDFYASVFGSLGIGQPAADIPRSSAAPSPAAAPAAAEASAAPSAAPSRQMLAAVQAATSLIKAHRTHGHLGAHLDPLGTPPFGDPAMEPETYGLTPDLMELIPADVLRVYVPGRNLAEVLPNLRRTYCGTIAYEIEHIASHEQRVWLREHIESGAYRMPFSPDQKRRLLQRLTKVEAMERYLRRTFIGQKTFSAEGVDAMIPMLEGLLTTIADDGIGEVVMGMSHRGRLATIAHVVNRPYAAILVAFERGEMRRAVASLNDAPTGDVKYHIGSTGTYITDTGKGIAVRLLSNPSHLEAVDPVVEGWTRAEQTRRTSSTLHVDPMAAVPVLLHGDAAFAGQGIVAEVFNLQSLGGYATGGTVHLITNNQVGFTTDASDARSTRYASDLAKGFDVPIVHVNADDIEACINAVRLAWDYRRTYHRDVVIDLIGYRRFGHNETDEPSYTQPLMYQKIKEHPTAREIYMHKLVAEGLITEADGANDFETAYGAIAEAHKKVKATLASDVAEESEESTAAETETPRPSTRVARDTLITLNEQLIAAPDDFHVYPKLAKQLERRQTAAREGKGIDWGTAESLAFASLLTEGHPIRLSGQDTQRGTFSQRHLVFHDDRTGAQWVPMQNLVGAEATFEVYNSPLSEVGCLGFEYGYSAADPTTTVLWEAQYGDFVNNAEMVVDQFISSALAKWGQRSRLVMLLPHGYEGNGPEHSSARLERFLQLAAHGNMRVANCSTAAQYFHLLRDQAIAPTARPLVIMTPKRLLRLAESSCTLDELASGEFRAVLDDPVTSASPKQRKNVHTMLLCTGKVYYELELHPDRREAEDLAIVRIELLNPLPVDDVLALIRTYPNLEQIYWVQEEPANMGAWPHLSRPIGKRRPYDIRWDYIGRPRRASPSEGSAGSHHIEQERIINSAIASSPILARKEASDGTLQHADLAASSDPKTAGDS